MYTIYSRPLITPNAVCHLLHFVAFSWTCFTMYCISMSWYYWNIGLLVYMPLCRLRTQYFIHCQTDKHTFLEDWQTCFWIWNKYDCSNWSMGIPLKSVPQFGRHLPLCPDHRDILRWITAELFKCHVFIFQLFYIFMPF